MKLLVPLSARSFRTSGPTDKAEASPAYSQSPPDVTVDQMSAKLLVVLLCAIREATQECQVELSTNGIPILWPVTPDNTTIESTPLCFAADGEKIKRFCNNSKWYPELNNLPICMTVVEEFNMDGCPPGYLPISEHDAAYCYRVHSQSTWNYPCLTSGGAAVITDLNEKELTSLTASLGKEFNYYWLPGHRQKPFNPVVWTIPGRNWGDLITPSNFLPYHESIFSNCLRLSVHEQRLTTGACDRSFPSLCLYVNQASIPANCPSGYHALRFMPQKNSCFGIETSTSLLGSTYNDFLQNSCEKPMGSTYVGNLERFIFMKIAELTGLSSNSWCWYHSAYMHNGTSLAPEDLLNSSSSSIATDVTIASLQGMINSVGTLALMNIQGRLPCMACEKYVNYDTSIILEYNSVDQNMYLTIYSPLGLWKDWTGDKGVQCFSDANGFFEIMDINDTPYLDTEYMSRTASFRNDISKVVYKIEPITDRSAQYWCEGHLKNFTLLETSRILINPKGENEHVFALVIKTKNAYSDGEDFPTLTQIIHDIMNIFNAKQVLLMDILDVNELYIMALFHVHVNIGETTDDLSYAGLLVKSYKQLLEKANSSFPEHGITFINMSSSTVCLPSTTNDMFPLNWELTYRGQISAPKQFCLQENGLPVTRRCGGVYPAGAFWLRVDGNCSENYTASNTTTFLYNVAKGQVPPTTTSNFLTNDLVIVLEDLNIIIPADIYYLSMSLQYILRIANVNSTCINIGDINNIAWIMDQVMLFDWQYLKLAQTLNSTSVIVDSINNIIEMIADKTHPLSNNTEYFYANNHLELAREPNFVLQVSYPYFNHISGLAIASNISTNNFTDMDIIQLNQFMTLEDILNIENLEAAAWVPSEVLNTLRLNSNDSNSNQTISKENVHVIISIFSNNAVFQEIDRIGHNVKGRILGISIPGFVSNLEYPVFIAVKDTKDASFKGCGYWNFNSDVDYQDGHSYWATDGCYLIGVFKNLTVCQCFHLTHFGQLIWRDQGGNSSINLSSRNKALNVITLVGCFLSIVGIAGIWVTAIVFQTWRKKPGTKVLLQLSLAIALPLVVMLIYNLDLGLFAIQDEYFAIVEDKRITCIVFGTILHYSILSGFTWMLITAILQFIRYVRVLGVHRPTRFMCKLAMIGWGTPLIPVVITLLVDSNCYIPSALPAEYASITPICYPNGNAFYYAIIFPIASVLFVNVVLFVLVLYSISRGPDGKFRSADMDLICAQLRLSIFLFFLLGLTWIFGIFSFTENGQLLSYLFCLTSTLQGFVLFVYFVVCDPATRLLWVSLMKPQFRMSVTSLTSVN